MCKVKNIRNLIVTRHKGGNLLASLRDLVLEILCTVLWLNDIPNPRANEAMTRFQKVCRTLGSRLKL